MVVLFLGVLLLVIGLLIGVEMLLSLLPQQWKEAEKLLYTSPSQADRRTAFRHEFTAAYQELYQRQRDAAKFVRP